MDDARGQLDQAGPLPENGGAGVAAVFEPISEDEGQGEGVCQGGRAADSIEELGKHEGSLVVVGMARTAAKTARQALRSRQAARGPGKRRRTRQTGNQAARKRKRPLPSAKDDRGQFVTPAIRRYPATSPRPSAASASTSRPGGQVILGSECGHRIHDAGASGGASASRNMPPIDPGTMSRPQAR